ncbi:MAG: stage II sporulation protein D [Clostridia bacterium]|nr:stage II sporulation protein D [Clostridia bacterium]
MKFILIVSLIVLVIVFLSRCNEQPIENIQLILKPTAPQISLYPYIDEEVTLRVAISNDSIEEMALEEYLIGVVAAEMPVSFEMEALKAQAVAARTFTLRHIPAFSGTPCSSRADICTNSSCCQAWRSESDMKKNWGDSYDDNAARIENAVAATTGMVITYEGELIEALYHSSSGGFTEYAQNVFAHAKPYLVGVSSPDTDYEKSYTFTIDELTEKLNNAFKGASITSLKTDLAILSRYESGRVESVRIGKKIVSGRELRQALNLSSAAFSYRYDGKNIIITTKGFGHGVGMSQYGANAFAENGYTYDEILKHYYKGVSLIDLNTLFDAVNVSNNFFVP